MPMISCFYMPGTFIMSPHNAEWFILVNHTIFTIGLDIYVFVWIVLHVYRLKSVFLCGSGFLLLLYDSLKQHWKPLGQIATYCSYQHIIPLNACWRMQHIPHPPPRYVPLPDFLPYLFHQPQKRYKLREMQDFTVNSNIKSEWEDMRFEWWMTGVCWIWWVSMILQKYVFE